MALLWDANALKFAKLNGSNYRTWAFNVRLYLESLDLFEHVDGTAEPPGADASAELRRKLRPVRRKLGPMFVWRSNQNNRYMLEKRRLPKRLGMSYGVSSRMNHSYRRSDCVNNIILVVFEVEKIYWIISVSCDLCTIS